MSRATIGTCGCLMISGTKIPMAGVGLRLLVASLMEPVFSLRVSAVREVPSVSEWCRQVVPSVSGFAYLIFAPPSCRRRTQRHHHAIPIIK